MIRSTLIILAQGIIQDVESNSISIFNIFEEIAGAGFPLFIQKCSILNCLERDITDPDSIHLHLAIKMGDVSIAEREVDVKFQDKLRSRMIVHLQGLPLPGPGKLKISFSNNEQLYGEYELAISSAHGPIVEGRSI